MIDGWGFSNGVGNSFGGQDRQSARSYIVILARDVDGENGVQVGASFADWF